MEPMDELLKSVERRLYDSLSGKGGIIPQTVDQVELAERNLDISEVEVPKRLCDAHRVFARIKGSDSNSAALPPVFGQLVTMLRKERSLSVEGLAATARIEVQEICQIETNPSYEPKPRTVS